jgi:hypothetical protein
MTRKLVRQPVVGQRVWYFEMAIPGLRIGPVFSGVITKVGWMRVEVTLTPDPKMWAQPESDIVKIWRWDIDTYLVERKHA